MQSPNSAPQTASFTKSSHQGTVKLTSDAVNNVTVYVTELLILNKSVTKPEIMRPNMLVMPTMEISKAAWDVDNPLDTARSGR